MSKNAIKGVLGNFLVTLVSRNTDYKGYWMFGHLNDEPAELQIDLLSPPSFDLGFPMRIIAEAAVSKFLDQLLKARFDERFLEAARLTIQNVGDVEAVVNGRPCRGREYRFIAEAVLVGGRRFKRQRNIIAAPHNPAAEYRSGRFT